MGIYSMFNRDKIISKKIGSVFHDAVYFFCFFYDKLNKVCKADKKYCRILKENDKLEVVEIEKNQQDYPDVYLDFCSCFITICLSTRGS